MYSYDRRTARGDSTRLTQEVVKTLQRLRPRGNERAVTQMLVKELKPLLTPEATSGLNSTSMVYGVLEPIKGWLMKHGIEIDPYDYQAKWSDIPWMVWEAISKDPYNPVP